MKVAITGANGFIGKRLSIKLTNQGHSVIKIQRTFSSGDYFLIKDIREIKNLKKILKEVDVIIHCASKVHEQGIFQKKSDYFSINTEATINLAKASIKAGVKRFIFLSTIKVNGEKTENIPFTNRSKEAPIGAYALSKYLAEENLIKLSQKYPSMDIVIIRPPLVYGPGVKANFYKLFKIINSRFYLPFKKISNKRSFIFIENLVDFIILCCKSKKVSNHKFLISDIDPISSTKLIKLIYKAIGKKERLFYIPKNLLYILNKLLFGALSKILESLEIDTSESLEITKWKPNYSSEEGIIITANWFMRENK